MDRERRHFVSSVGTELPGANIYRKRWRHVDGISKFVVTETHIPQIAETYCAAAFMIDLHNRFRQQDPHLGNKFLVRDWSIQVNKSIFVICIVDSWLLYKSSQGGPTTTILVEQMINYTFDLIFRRSSVAPETASQSEISGIGPHFAPTSPKRNRSDGTVANAFMQGKCDICKNDTKSKYICS